jgi:putative addiction module component (TIGR02574 family)
MDTQQIVEAFRRLPVDERARLVEELWDEVAREIEQRPLSEAARRLLDERIRQHNESPGDVEAWETARDDLRDLYLPAGCQAASQGGHPDGCSMV